MVTHFSNMYCTYIYMYMYMCMYLDLSLPGAACLAVCLYPSVHPVLVCSPTHSPASTVPVGVMVQVSTQSGRLWWPALLKLPATLSPSLQHTPGRPPCPWQATLPRVTLWVGYTCTCTCEMSYPVYQGRDAFALE